MFPPRASRSSATSPPPRRVILFERTFAPGIRCAINLIKSAPNILSFLLDLEMSLLLREPGSLRSLELIILKEVTFS
ncbi:MAG: hypothetical protein P8L83_07995 [Flavobacteriaceae bacterium]|nr:hypothetical protein [Flavobacteriaceae bacterium]